MTDEPIGKASFELKLMIAEAMIGRGIPVPPGDILITHGAKVDEWRAVLNRGSSTIDLLRVKAVEEIAEELAGKYHLVGAPG